MIPCMYPRKSMRKLVAIESRGSAATSQIQTLSALVSAAAADARARRALVGA